MIENMKEETFSDLGRVEAISRLYEGTPYKPFQDNRFETDGKSFVTSQSRTFMEGVDFDLVYFPLKHLGYKCVTAVTGELYASFSHPRTMDIRLGISSKLDFAQIRELWSGVVAAAKEHGYKKVGLDLLPSPNGLTVSVSCVGETSLLMGKRRPAAKSMDLICVSGNLGAAYLGFQVLERNGAHGVGGLSAYGCNYRCLRSRFFFCSVLRRKSRKSKYGSGNSRRQQTGSYSSI